MVALLHGYEKHKDPNEFLHDFFNEALHLINGEVNGKIYSFKISTYASL